MEEFEFKKLIVWQKSMDFADDCLAITEKIKGHYRLCEQLEACSCSIPQNIAEGKGRHSLKEFIHFLHISRGSLYEAITVLNIFQRRNYINKAQLYELEKQSLVILKMLNALITSKKSKAV